MVRRPSLLLLLPLLVVLVVWSAAPASAQDAELEPIVTGLEFASNVAFAPDGTAFFNEKDLGEIRVLRDGRVLDEPFASLPVLVTVNETGLLGLAVHPDFPDQPWVYAYYTDRDLGLNRLVRIRAEGDVGVEVEPLLGLMPVVGFHNGGDLTFGADGTLYVVTGETQQPERAQDPNDLGGKVLRLDADGSIPADNPFPGSAVYALGIRNSFGLCSDPTTGDLWETENGPDRFDELNRIVAGANYGWPTHLGPVDVAGFEDPVLAYETVIVPTGCTVVGETLYFGTARGEIHAVGIGRDGPPTDEVVTNAGEPVIDVARSPDGSLVVVTQHAIWQLTLDTRPSSEQPTGSQAETAPSGPSATATPAAAASEGLSPATIAIGLLLIGGMLLLRARAERRRPPRR
jgi:glucose/arabinose dehydrogenase